MAFCTNCGAQVPDGTKFCPSCGQKMAGGAAPSAAAPAQQSYQQPAQQDYQQQGGYQQPQQQSYQPPTQQSYANTAYAPAPEAPKQKKPLDKKTLIIIAAAALAVIIAVVLVVVLGGKGGADAAADPDLGVYNAKTAAMWGIDMDVSDLFENGFSIELKKNGKCAINANGTKGNGKWTLEDGALHVSGGGLDCDGTLEYGVMTLEDVLGMGVTLGFEKEGADGAASGGASASGTLAQQWNGTWYGCLYMSGATGDYAGMAGNRYDAYMQVSVDGAGQGTFAVYLDGADKALASGECSASADGLYAQSGTVAGGADMDTYNWMFLPMPDYPDQYTMADTVEDGGGTMEFSLFMKKWGSSWQAEIDSGFAIVPPSVAVYEDEIAAGSGAQASSGASGGSGAAALTGDTDVYNYLDQVYVSYPTDTFYIDDTAILDTVAAKDGSVTIGIIVQISAEDHDASMEYFDSYSTYDGYTTTDLTVAGYEARMITFIDDWGDYCANVHVNFGGSMSGNYGVNFSMTSSVSMDDCTSDAVMAILNTLTVVG